MPRILLLSTTTGYQLRSFTTAAEQLGVEVVLATDRCHHLDDPWRDGAVPVRFHDVEGSLSAIVETAATRPIHGVIAVGDRPTVLAGRVAHALRLPGNAVHAADACRSKKLMRRAFAEAGMRRPWVMDLGSEVDAHTAAARARYPCVLKPLGLSGSRGVIRADSPQQFEHAVERIRALLARPEIRAQRTGLTGELLVEGYLEGSEYAVEGILTRGELRVLAIFAKPDPLSGPFFEETIYVTPPRIPIALEHQIVDEVRLATVALGLWHGPIHAECRVGSRGPVMLEVAARPIGGLCSRALRFEREGELISLEALLIRQATGEDISGIARERDASGVMMIPIPRRGIFRGVTGDAAARATRHVDHVAITAKQDQLLEPLPEGDSYLGFIFARAPHPDAVVSALREAHAKLAFDIGTELPVARA